MARKPESIFWDRVRPLLTGLHPVRVENSTSSGTPDVNCTLGWIELKRVAAKDIPKWDETLLRIDHYTDVQRIFQLKRGMAGGACWVLMLLDRDWLLFTSDVAALRLGRMTTQETRSAAARLWAGGGVTSEALQAALRETAVIERSRYTPA